MSLFYNHTQLFTYNNNSLYHLIPDVLQEEDALLVLVVQLPEGGAVLVHPVGSEAVLIVAEAVIPAGTDAVHFREGGGQNLAIRNN